MVFLFERNAAIEGLQVKLESDPFWDCQNITWNKQICLYLLPRLKFDRVVKVLTEVYVPSSYQTKLQIRLDQPQNSVGCIKVKQDILN